MSNLSPMKLFFQKVLGLLHSGFCQNCMMSAHLVAEIHNLGQNHRRLFCFLAQFVFTTSETGLDYFHQKMNVWVASRVANQLTTRNLRKLGDFKKISEMLLLVGEYHPFTQKPNFDAFLVKNCKTSAVKHSIKKPILLNFVNLSPTFFPRLYCLLLTETAVLFSLFSALFNYHILSL